MRSTPVERSTRGGGDIHIHMHDSVIASRAAMADLVDTVKHQLARDVFMHERAETAR
jgi:hypothetical protein